MNYIQSTLIKDEKIVVLPKIHPIVYWNPILCSGILVFLLLTTGTIVASQEIWDVLKLTLFFIFIVAIFWYVLNKLYYKNVEMAVTNKRVVTKTGIISVHTEELQWNRIESIEVRQGILGRLLNYGDVYFSGTGSSSVLFCCVVNPWDTKAKSAEILSR